ncbi:hypothetical protein YPPY09_3519, partial [Yersinia pestis PY-09]
MRSYQYTAAGAAESARCFIPLDRIGCLTHRFSDSRYGHSG